MKPATSRLWEVDSLRGVAVVLMAFFHLMWDLQYFGLSHVDVFAPSWQTFARGIGSTFIFLMGLSLTLDAACNTTDSRGLFMRHLKRGMTIFGFGLAVTGATYLIVGDEFVRFGILHQMGVAIILAFFFVRTPIWLNLGVSALIIALGIWVSQIPVTTALLLPFGLVPRGMSMVDYYPLIPWFGVVLVGISVGQWLYPTGQSRFNLPDLGSALPVHMLRWLGRSVASTCADCHRF